MNDDKHTDKDLAAGFGPLFKRLKGLQRRFRPGTPYIEKPAKGTKRPHSHRKAERRRINRAARRARRQNRRTR